MTEFKIEDENCIECGTCAVECPMGIIQIEKYPHMPESNEGCSECGHCEAICPQGVIELANSSINGFKNTLNPEKVKITPEKMGYYMRNRRSHRNYMDKAIEKEKLEELFDIVRFAPSAGNGQPLSWIVIDDPQKVREISETVINWIKKLIEEDSPIAAMFPLAALIEPWDKGIDVILRGAPALVISHASKDLPFATVDGAIALTYFELALPSFGLGGCWAGLFHMACNQSPELQEKIGIPNDHVPIGSMMVGYPKYQYQRIPKRNKIDLTWK